MKRFLRKCGAFFKRFFRRLWGWMRQNFGMKIAAIVFAFILWSYVLVTTDPLRTKTVSALPVQLSNVEVLHERGLALVEDIASTVSVRVTVEANNERLSYVTDQSVTVQADLSGIVQEGVYRLEITASSQYGTVRRVSPSYIDVNVEELVTRTVPVEAQVPDAPQGQWASQANLFPSQVTVSGAASLVDRVEQMTVTLPQEDIAENVVKTLEPVLTDADGHAVTGNLKTDTTSVVLTMHYYPTAQVPVSVSSQITAADGYVIEDIQPLTETVTVAAPTNTLSQITQVETQTLTAANLREDTTLEVQLALPEGAAHVEPQSIKVRVRVEEEETTATFRDVAVEARRQTGEDSYVTALNVRIAPVDVTVTGRRSDVAAVQLSDLVLYADVTNLRSGQRATLLWQWKNAQNMPKDVYVTMPETVSVQIL